LVKITILAASLILLISFGSCQADEPTATKNDQSIMITDGMGREVEVPLNPDRIVCVNAAAAEVIYVLDSPDRIVAVTSACTMPPTMLEKEVLGRSALSLEAEPIIALKPDLVIEGVPPLKEDVRKQLEEAGIPVLQYWALHADKILPMIDDFGVILGKEERSQELHDFIEGYYDLSKDRMKDLQPESKPGVYYMIMNFVISQPGFDEIKAVREGKIYIIDTGIVTGPRQIVGFLHFAKWFHPQLFEDIDPEAVHKEMLSRFYNVNEEGCWAYP